MINILKIKKLSPLTIDLNKAPLSQDDLAQLRIEASEIEQDVRVKLNSLKYLSLGVLLLLLIGVFTAWSKGIISGEEAVAIAFPGAVAIAFAFTIVFAGAFAVVVAVVGAVAVAVAGAGVVTFAVAVAALTAVVVAVDYYERLQSAANKRLEKLVELNAEDMADQCIAYDKLREDPQVEAYHQQITSMERMPVVAEYEAAAAWLDSANERISQAEKMQQAIKVCERMSDPQERTNTKGKSMATSTSYQNLLVGEGEAVIDGKTHWKDFIQVYIKDHNEAMSLAVSILRQIENQQHRDDKSYISFSLTGSLEHEES